MIAGVAAGLAERLGVDAMIMRIVFVTLAFAGGFGLVAYGLLWLAAPAQQPGEAVRRRPASAQQGVALGLITLGGLLLLRSIGLWFGDAVVMPVILAAAGSAVVWSRSDDDDRQRWSQAAPRVTSGALAAAAGAPMSPARVTVGTALIAIAAAVFLAANATLDALWELILALFVAVGGLALLFGPWIYRLVQQLTNERRERIRQEERAELAAHLHDSVLQTLALIQRSADDPQRMVGLARRQERELRGWLYTPSTTERTSVERALRSIASDVETRHSVAVEAVVVGDCDVDDAARALLAAVREACVNAAKHAQVARIDVFAEIDDERIVAFVRDRGVGFDASAIPDDRQGIRSSILARVRRHGGDATITSAPSEGTEIELWVPRAPQTDDQP